MAELECLPYGTGSADEGVCLLLRMGPYQILLDCGLRDYTPLKAILRQLDLVWCSHAHPDHARGLLALHRARPQIPCYASEVTNQLLPLNWTLSTETGFPQICRSLPWRSAVELRQGLSGTLFPAGHLPGAAVLLLTYTPLQSDRATPYTVLYTGDFFLSNSRLVEGLPLAELRGLRPNVLILEGSYGTARFTHRRQQENLLAERISQAIIQGRSVLLPVPFLGLGQELLMILRSHHLFTGRDFDIWVESPLAAGCDAYLQILPHLPANVQNFARHQPLFWDERVRPRVSRLPVNDRLPVDRPFPCIVLADQEGDWHRFYQGDPQSWLVLLPQSPGRLAITDSDTGSTPVLGDRPVAIETYFLAEHCDGSGTTQLIHNIRPQHVVFVHGSPPYLADLTGLDELYNRYHLHSPAAHTLVELPVGETFYQPPAPDTSYEGELTETESSVTLTLPHTVTLDPRWQQFADTGLVVARWQGEELVLRGLSQRELLH